jgi:hypothetical protein
LIQRKAIGRSWPKFENKEKAMTASSRPFHQLVWLDHQVARLYEVARDHLTELATIHAADEGRGHIHHKAGTVGPGHVGLERDYLENITTALQGAQEILIVGPADTKHQLKKHLALNVPLLAKRVVGVEPMDKCDLGDLQAYASLFFRQADRMRPSRLDPR